MSAYFCISVRLLDETYHGRADRGEPEWPPSPMRLVQALVAAAARRRGDGTLAESDQAALQWLERLAPPTIAAPTIELGTKYRLYVPDNIADKVAGTWSRGGEASIADYRTEKDVQVVQLRGADPTLHFLWPLPAAADAAVFVETLQALARRVTHLGWGVDMAAVNARVLSIAEVEDLPGHRWSPVAAGGVSRRVPIAGSLAALIRRHNAFLQRLPSPDSFAVVPPF
ncbi:MAG TPA: type I-U CRISPR-associated protein Csb2, partial [Pirellulales bacterium]